MQRQGQSSGEASTASPTIGRRGSSPSYNGNDIRIVKVEGEFVWHLHEDTDDFFLVLDGVLDIELRDRTVTLAPGELFVVPRGDRASAGGAAMARSR